MQATEKKTSKVWMSIVSVGVVIAIIIGVVALVNSSDTKANAIPTINQQVDNIKDTLPELETVSTELKGYIDTLETTLEKLQTDLATTNAAIDTLETEVYGKVDEENTATLNQLKADKAELEGKIAAANKAIEDAKTANNASEKAIADQIAVLEAELEKADADNKKALEDSIAALETALTTADADNKKALEDSIAALKTVMESGDASLTTAIQTLNTNLSTLIKANADNIATLQTTANDLQTQINAIDTDISGIKTELEGKISESEKKVLGELNALKTDIEGQIATINTDIAALKAKDTELDGKITDLKAYVDGEITATEDWANATFATLTQYSEIQTDISAIKTAIDNLNKWNQQTDNLLAQKFDDIDKAIEALRTDLPADYAAKIEAAVKEVTDAYSSAIAAAKGEIEAAYTTAIATAITNSETSMKEWVNETLADGYYTVAQVDAEIAALEAQIAVGDAELKEELEEQKTVLETAKTELTDAYKAAIEEAITKHNGEVTKKIDDDIAAAKKELQDQIDDIKTEITNIKTRLDALESDVAALLTQIQSVNYIPMYDDGKVKVAADSAENKYAFFDFMISPKSALAGVDEAKLTQYLSMQAIYTKRAETRGDEQNAVSFVNMEILDVAYNATTGVLTVKASGNDLNADFYNANIYASAFLTITTGKTEIISDYIPMVAHSTVWVNIVTVEDWINVTINGGEAEEVN